MTDTEFKTQLQRLNETFKNYYSTDRAKAVAAIVKELPADYFRKCIDRAIWADFPPKLDWYKRIRSEFRNISECLITLHHDHESMPPDRVRSLIDGIFKKGRSL